MVPKIWLKHGELYTDENFRSVIVCSECQKWENTFYTYTSTNFWQHVKNVHPNKCPNGKAAESFKKARKDTSPSIIIDISDDDSDASTVIMETELDNCKRKQKRRSGDNGNKCNVITRHKTEPSHTVQDEQATTVQEECIGERGIESNIILDHKTVTQNNVQTEQEEAQRSEIDGAKPLSNDPMPIVSEDSDSDSDDEPEWVDRVSLMLKHKIDMKLTSEKCDQGASSSSQSKRDEFFTSLQKPIIKFIKYEVTDNEVDNEIELILDQAVEDELEKQNEKNSTDENVQENCAAEYTMEHEGYDEIKLEMEVAMAVHEVQPQYEITSSNANVYPNRCDVSSQTPTMSSCNENSFQQQQEDQQNQEKIVNECDICGKLTKSKHGLTLHRVIKHKIHKVTNPVHSCPLCHKIYQSAGYLRKHKFKKHGIGTMPTRRNTIVDPKVINGCEPPTTSDEVAFFMNIFKNQQQEFQRQQAQILYEHQQYYKHQQLNAAYQQQQQEGQNESCETLENLRHILE